MTRLCCSWPLACNAVKVGVDRLSWARSCSADVGRECAQAAAGRSAHGFDTFFCTSVGACGANAVCNDRSLTPATDRCAGCTHAATASTSPDVRILGFFMCLTSMSQHQLSRLVKLSWYGRTLAGGGGMCAAIKQCVCVDCTVAFASLTGGYWRMPPSGQPGAKLSVDNSCRGTAPTRPARNHGRRAGSL